MTSNLIVRPALSVSSSVNSTASQPTRSRSDASIRYRHPTLSHIINNNLKNIETHEDSRQSRYYRMSSDISSMFSIREKIQNLVEMSINIVIENDATPDIENGFEPVLRAIERSYPPFHKQGINYFTTLSSMQETAKTNQLLSSAGVKIPLQNFTNDWKRLCSVIDHFTNTNPPPHAKEIASKFKAVRSSLDTIKKTNERRKHPTPSISSCITNILALGESVSNNIDNLFSHNYTEFGSNLYDSLRRDVKSFLTVINEAFSNEFVQSGVMLCDLYRIRSNIFTDCNEIVEALKSAFLFPKEMREIKELKDTTETELKPIVDKLSVQFVVIKPAQTDAASQISPNDQRASLLSDETSNNGNLNESETNDNIQNFLERDEIVPQAQPKQDYLATLNRIDEFASKVFEILERKVDYTKDTWDNLDEIVRLVGCCKETVKDNEKKIENLKREILALKEKVEDDQLTFEKKNEALVKANEYNKSKIGRIEGHNKDLTQKNAQLQIEIDKVRLKYSNLKAKGNASVFRRALIDIGKMADSTVKIDFLNQTELIEKVKNIVREAIDQPCLNCPLLEDQLKKSKNELICLIEKLDKLKDESVEMSKKFQVHDDKSATEKKTLNKKVETHKSTSSLPKVEAEMKRKFLFTTQPPSYSDTNKPNKLSKSGKTGGIVQTGSFVAKVRTLNPLKGSLSSDSDTEPAKPADEDDRPSLKELACKATVIQSEPSFRSLTIAAASKPSQPSLKELAAQNGPSLSELASADTSKGGAAPASGLAKNNCEEDRYEDVLFSADGSGMNVDMRKAASGGRADASRQQQSFTGLIREAESILEDREHEAAELYKELSISKQPVIDAIQMIDPKRDRGELQAFLPSRLKSVLHELIRDILNKSEQAKQAFKKRESQYIKTLFQIGEKLSRMLNEEPLEVDEKQEASSQRDRIIDQISSQLKTIRQNASNLESEVAVQKKSNSDLRRQRDSIRLSYCSLFNFSPDDNDRNNIEKCQKILQKEKNGYIEKIKNLTEKVDSLQSEAVAVEELINGASQQKEGTLHEKLEGMHDAAERMKQNQKKLEEEVSSLKDTMMNVASILENRNDMDSDKSLAYVSEFCRMHSGGVKVIDVAKFDLLFGKFEYNKDAPLYDILESFLSKKNQNQTKC